MVQIKIPSLEPKYSFVRSGKSLIASLGPNTIRRSKKRKKARCVIFKISLQDLSNIIKESEYLPFEGYVQKRHKQVPAGSYFYIEIYLDKFMMKLYMHIGPVRKQNNNTQKMNNYDMSTQKIPNLHV